MARTRERFAERAEHVRPYVERAFKDEEVRENLKSALATAREIYDELIGNRSMTGVATRVATDKEVQENLRRAIEDLRQAADRVQGKDSHSGRNAALLVAGIAIGILVNPVTGPAARKWVMNVVSGGEDEFDYEGGGTNSR